MKITITLLLLTIALSQAIQIPMKSLNVTEVKDLALGFVVGADGAMKVQDGYPCVNALTESSPEVQEAIADLQSGNEAQMMEGIHKLFNVLSGLKPCREAVTEGEAWFNDIKNAFESKPAMIQGFMRLAKNQKLVVEDIQNFKSSWDSDQMFMAGLKLGDILKTFVWGQDGAALNSFINLPQIHFEPKYEDVKQTVFGILVGSHAVTDSVQGKSCADYLENDIGLVTEAVAALSKGNIGGTIEAMKKLFSLLNENKEIQKCISVMNGGTQWFDKVSKRFSSWTQAQIGGAFLVYYWYTTADDIGQTVWHFQHKDDYFKAGELMGNVFSIYVFGTPEGPKQSVNSFLSLALGGVPTQFTECGLTAPKIKVSGVTLGQSPTKGVKDSITVVGTVSEHEEMKSVDINVTLGNAPLHKESLAKSDIYEAGDAFNFNYDVLIPGFAPSGAYDVSFTMKNAAGESIGCVDVKFNL